MSAEIVTIYIDAEKINSKKAVLSATYAAMNDEISQINIIFTGKIIRKGPINKEMKILYKSIAEYYDISFTHDDNIPKFEFYPVPRLAIIAYDSLGGCFVSTNAAVNLTKDDASIYYIDRKLKAHYLSPNLKSFFEMVIFYPSWKKDMGLSSSVPSVPIQKQQLLYLILKLDNTKFKLHKKRKNIDNIVIYPSFDDAKKEINFYDMEETQNLIYQDQSFP
ncbi:MAG: hypothetical protein FWC47_09280 [Oscillospiraceae bacterium]|nr:hypothetical protein [Oscillospiraceae bacterium]